MRLPTEYTASTLAGILPNPKPDVSRKTVLVINFIISCFF